VIQTAVMAAESRPVVVVDNRCYWRPRIAIDSVNYVRIENIGHPSRTNLGDNDTIEVGIHCHMAIIEAGMVGPVLNTLMRRSSMVQPLDRPNAGLFGGRLGRWNRTEWGWQERGRRELE